MRRKIPKSSREEINRISAEKQERILRHLSEAGALTIKKVAQDLGMAHSDTRNQFGNLRVKNAIDCVGRCKDGYLYTIHRDDTKSYREQLEENQSGEAIWPETIARFRRRVAPGAVYHYRDEDGARKRTKVTDTRYPHICLFDNGQAYTWADVARCSRPGIRTLGEWEK